MEYVPQLLQYYARDVEYIPQHLENILRIVECIRQLHSLNGPPKSWWTNYNNGYFSTLILSLIAVITFI